MKRFESFCLDVVNQCLVQRGAQIDLAPKPFAVLRFLVENPGRLITHDELLDAVWPETYVQPQVLRTYMLELRKVLGDDAGQPRFIQTLPKRGYRFVAAVTDAAAAPTAAQERAELDTQAAPGILGREPELGLLQAELKHLSEGERRAVFITGESGIGKTALVDAFCRQLGMSRTVAIARGQCVQGLGLTDAYYPVTEALSQLCAGPDGEAACKVLARLAPAWLAHGRRADSETPNVDRDRTLGDLCAALEQLSAEKPLVFVFEDLHWADDCTLNLISALARRRARAPLMLVATLGHRRENNHDLAIRLMQDLAMRRLGTEIALAPLNRVAVNKLISRQLGQETVPAGLAGFVYQRSEGNPLFVIAVVDNLIALGILGRSGGSEWRQCEPFPETDAGVPDALAHMIELEIDRLSEEDQRLLEAASVLSVAFPAWAVAAALGQDAVDTEESCDALARRLHFVVRAGQDELPDGTKSAFYVFAHGLYREVLYRRQASARRARRHVRIADRLGELFAGREEDVARERALHYEAAGEMGRAAPTLKVAAETNKTPAGVC
jgi:predicted ATPase